MSLQEKINHIADDKIPFIEFHPGLTKRELFAAMAMYGILASDTGSGFTANKIATYSIQRADALIKELEK